MGSDRLFFSPFKWLQYFHALLKPEECAEAERKGPEKNLWSVGGKSPTELRNNPPACLRIWDSQWILNKHTHGLVILHEIINVYSLVAAALAGE